MNRYVQQGFAAEIIKEAVDKVNKRNRAMAAGGIAGGIGVGVAAKPIAKHVAQKLDAVNTATIGKSYSMKELKRGKKAGKMVAKIRSLGKSKFTRPLVVGTGALAGVGLGSLVTKKN